MAEDTESIFISCIRIIPTVEIFTNVVKYFSKSELVWDGERFGARLLHDREQFFMAHIDLGPMPDDLSIRRAGLLEGLGLVGVLQVLPQVSQSIGNGELLDALASHPDMLEFGQQRAVQMSQLIAIEEFGSRVGILS